MLKEVFVAMSIVLCFIKVAGEVFKLQDITCQYDVWYLALL